MVSEYKFNINAKKYLTIGSYQNLMLNNDLSFLFYLSILSKTTTYLNSSHISANILLPGHNSFSVN
jgi:hypothetical protein